MHAARLFYPDWAPPTALGDGDGGVPGHCLTPPDLLRALRTALAPKADAPPRKTTVVYYTRATDKMRKLHDEAALVQALRSAVPVVSRAGRRAPPTLTFLLHIFARPQAPWELVVFDGKNYGVPETLALFRSAVAVVGVHGGGLANIIGGLVILLVKHGVLLSTRAIPSSCLRLPGRHVVDRAWLSLAACSTLCACQPRFGSVFCVL